MNKMFSAILLAGGLGVMALMMLGVLPGGGAAPTAAAGDNDGKEAVAPRTPLTHYLFVDCSPPKFSPQQSRDVRTLLDAAYQDLKVGEELELHASIHGEVSSLAEPIVKVTGVARSQAELPPGAPTVTDAYLKTQPDRIYKREVLPAIEKIMDLETPLAQESPVFGYICMYSDALSKSDAVRKRITVVSDLVNNSPGLDQYRQGFNFARFRETPKYQREKPDLRNVEVHIYLLQRNFREFSDDDIIEFWEALVRDCGATDITIRVLRKGVE